MYRTAQTDFDGRFALDAWTANNITSVPMNFQGNTAGGEFVRFGIFPGNGSFVAAGVEQIDGFAEVNIFVLVGEGERRAYEIADLLDDVLQGVSTGNTQFFKSTITKVGIDQENPSLYRVDYRVPFRTTSK